MTAQTAASLPASPEPHPEPTTGDAGLKNGALAVLLQLVPLIASPLIVPSFLWGLGYLYLGRWRRFLLALAAALVFELGLPLMLYLLMRLSPTRCASSAEPGECALLGEQIRGFICIALGFVAMLCGVTVTAVDAQQLVTTDYRARDTAAAAAQNSAALIVPPSLAEPSTESVATRRVVAAFTSVYGRSPSRTGLQLLCAVEAAGLTPEEATRGFWPSLRPGWLDGFEPDEPFPDAALNALYRELLALRQPNNREAMGLGAGTRKRRT